MNTELKNWAEKVIEDVTPILEKYKIDFYPFQDTYKADSEILVIGLNPASDGYDGTKEVYENRNKIDLSIEQIFNGNSAFTKNKNEWKIYKNLMKISFFNDLSENFNYMNYVYFPTPKFNDIKNIKDFDVIRICKSLTLDFIKIIRPKVIIVLGTNSGIDKMAKNTKTILYGKRKRLLVEGEIEGIKAYGIPHPSYNNHKEEDAEISKVLELLIKGQNIEPYRLYFPKTLNKKISKINFNINKINENLKEFDFSFKEFNGKKGLYQAVVKGLNNDILDFRLDVAKSYLSFRSNEKVNNSFYELEGKDMYVNFFNEIAEIDKHNWLVYKNLRNYKSDQSIEEQIVNDLKNFFQKLK